MQVEVYTSGEPRDIAYLLEGERQRYFHEVPEKVEMVIDEETRKTRIIKLKDADSRDFGHLNWKFSYLPASVIIGNFSEEFRNNLESILTHEGLHVSSFDSEGNILYDSLEKMKEQQRKRRLNV